MRNNSKTQELLAAFPKSQVEKSRTKTKMDQTDPFCHSNVKTRVDEAELSGVGVGVGSSIDLLST